MLKVVNTRSWEKEEFKSIESKKVRFYHCGPTVYWNQHIGNLRAVVLVDLIRRSFSFLGYDVKLVRNYTDFGHLTSDADIGEDKMEKASKRESLSPQEIANKYISSYEKDIRLLNTIEPTIQARATDYLPQMIDIIGTLIKKGFAYLTEKAVYFEIEKFPTYHALSHHIAEHNIEGAGHGDARDKDKKNSSDFVLWFFKTGDHKNALQFWPSPFVSKAVENGNGFPGWHIECSAMVLGTLGETIDIHMGGVEHISIHHTNEIAQSESFTGKPLANYWLHNEHLMLNGKKISKSDGNMYLLSEITDKGYDPIDLRYFFLQSHYRSKQNFTWEALDGSKSARNRLIAQYKKNITESNAQGTPLKDYINKFTTELENDFNIPSALGMLWDLVRSGENPADINATIDIIDSVFGLKIRDYATSTANDPQVTNNEILKLIEERNKARANKNWQKSDDIRNILENKYDYKVVDTKNN